MRKSVSKGAASAAKGAARAGEVAFGHPLSSLSKYWNLSMGRLKSSVSKGKIDMPVSTPANGKTRVVSVTPRVDSPDSSPPPEPADDEAPFEEKVAGAVEAVNEAVSEWATGIVAWATEKGLLDQEAQQAQAPPPPPALVEVAIVKHGVPWRGSYQRTLVVGEGKVVTLDPETRRETNVWLSPRDVPKAVTNAADGTIALSVAPWPEAPEWLHQKFHFSVAGEDAASERDATVKALSNLGVAVEAC